MSNVSVAEMLKILGKWTKSKPFAEFVAEKKRISERQAYNLIKKAWENHEIIKETLRNRVVLYGLAEFGQPIKEFSEYSKLMEELKEISKIAVISTDVGWERLHYFTNLLPLPLKKKIHAVIDPLAEDKSLSDSLSLKIALDKISTILHKYT